MSKIKPDKTMQIEIPDIVLKRKDFSTIGKIPASGISYKENFNAANELSFQVHKLQNGTPLPFWEALNDYNLIYIPAYKEYFDMHVSLTEETDTVKSVHCISLAESELSQIKLYDLEINTDNDLTFKEEEPTLFYRDLSRYNPGSDIYKKKKRSSLLHRILDKAGHYSIGYVSNSLKDWPTWYSFSISDSTIYETLTGEVAKQYQCLFTFTVNDDGTRLVNVYDLCCYCSDCQNRGDFFDSCPKCGGKNVFEPYGTDTAIFISKDNLASSASVESNKDQLKNCFRVSGGDDMITAAVSACNPGEGNYLYSFSDELLSHMPNRLAQKLREYQTGYQQYTKERLFSLSGALTANYNSVVSEINRLYPESGFQTVSSPIRGYEKIIALHYDLLDFLWYLDASMMPTPKLDGQDMDAAVRTLTPENLSPIAVTDHTKTAITVINNAILGMAKVYVNTARFKISITNTAYEQSNSPDMASVWRGKLTLTDMADDTVKTETPELTVYVNSDQENFLRQKLYRTLSKNENAVKELTQLELPADGDSSDAVFSERLRYYSIHYLENTLTALNDCISIIDSSENRELQLAMKSIYEQRAKKTNDQIEIMTGFRSHVNALLSKVTSIEETAKIELDLKTRIGEDLWNLFLSYRREDSYQNDNYVSDGLTNAQLIEKANELIHAAKKELYKASHLQYSVSASLGNLLALKEFERFADDFDCGNWIHMMADETVYRLRLLSYQIDFNNLSKITVEFSTVEKIWSGISDVESILSSASSIAGSYSSTISQVNHSVKAAGYVEHWIEKGLDATATKIVNNADNQDIVIDKTGILCRKYIDLEDSYDPQQIKIISNGLYLMDYTKNQETVKTGIGKFIYLDPKHNFRETVGYGVIADIVASNIVLSEEVGVYAPNGSVSITGDGITINNGKITWGTGVNAPLISDIDGLPKNLSSLAKDSAALNTKIATFQSNVNALLKASISVTEIGEDYVFSPFIGGGHLYIKHPNDGRSVTVDPAQTHSNGGYIFKVTDTNGRITIGADSNGNATFAGTIHASAGEFKGSITGGSININNRFRVDSAGNVTLPTGTKITWSDVTGTGEIATKDYVTGQGYQTESDVAKLSTEITENTIRTANLIAENLHVNAAHINGKLRADQINTTGLIAENISGTAIDGKTITGSTIRGGHITGCEIEAKSFSAYSSINMQFAEGHSKITVFSLGSATYPATVDLGVNKRDISDFKVYPDTEFYSNVFFDHTVYLGKNTYAENIEMNGNIKMRAEERQGITQYGPDTETHYLLDYNPKNRNTGIGMTSMPSDLKANTTTHIRGNAVTTESSGGVTPSDERLKNSFKSLIEFEKVYMDIEPCAFKYNNGTSGRYHFGAKAQNIKDAFEKNGHTTLDFGGFVQLTDHPENENYCGVDDPMGLIYTEFVMWNTHMIQKLYRENERLKQRIETLEQSMSK